MASEDQSLTIYDKAGRQVASTGPFGSPPAFPNHSTVSYKDGQNKKAFYYSGPDSSPHTAQAINIATTMEQYTWR
jgi:hypothetical protein